MMSCEGIDREWDDVNPIRDYVSIKELSLTVTVHKSSDRLVYSAVFQKPDASVFMISHVDDSKIYLPYPADEKIGSRLYLFSEIPDENGEVRKKMKEIYNHYKMKMEEPIK